jgi:ribosomal protein L11 methylase PrmA
VMVAFRDQGLTVVRRTQEEDWVCLVVQKE